MDNQHFLSSLLNLISWILVGISISWVVIKNKKNKNTGNIKLILLLIPISVLTGSLFALNNGFPEVGFDLGNTQFVFVSTFLSALPFVDKTKARLATTSRIRRSRRSFSLQSEGLKKPQVI